MSLISSVFHVGTGVIPESVRKPIGKFLEIRDQHFGLARFITPNEFENHVWHSDEFALVTLGRPLLRGEVGCALAHQHVYSKVLGGTSEWALVLEEDAKWCAGSEHHFTQVISALSRISEKPAVVLLGWNAEGVGPAVSPSPLRRMLGIPTGTFAYCINKSAAKVLSESHKIEHVADWPVSACRIRFFRPQHPVFIHDPKRESFIESVSSTSRIEANRSRIGVMRRVSLLQSKAQRNAFIHFVAIRAIAFAVEKFSRDARHSILARKSF